MFGCLSHFIESAPESPAPVLDNHGGNDKIEELIVLKRTIEGGQRLNHTELLLGIRRVLKFHERLRKEVCQTYGLSPIEVDILAFLHNNPQRDTASDIVELRMLPKGNVSQGVDALLRKGLLTRRQDEQDHRRIHLALTPAADFLRPALEDMTRNFQHGLFAGFDEQTKALYWQMNRRISQNAMEGMRQQWKDKE